MAFCFFFSVGSEWEWRPAVAGGVVWNFVCVLECYPNLHGKASNFMNNWDTKTSSRSTKLWTGVILRRNMDWTRRSWNWHWKARSQTWSWRLNTLSQRDWRTKQSVFFTRFVSRSNLIWVFVSRPIDTTQIKTHTSFARKKQAPLWITAEPLMSSYVSCQVTRFLQGRYPTHSDFRIV